MRTLVIIAVAHAAISPNETRSLLDGALDGIAAKLRYLGRDFMLAEPFPHVVVDGRRMRRPDADASAQELGAPEPPGSDAPCACAFPQRARW